MAQRFGGKFSPGGQPPGAGSAGSGGTAPGESATPPASPFRGRPATRVDVRALLMFLWPTPLLVAALGALSEGAAFRMALLLVSYGSLMLAAWLLREGQRAEAAYAARAIARPPAFPRKIAAAVLSGGGVALAAWLGTKAGGLPEIGRLLGGIAFGALTLAAHVMAFGIDPLRAKGTGETLAGGELDRVAEALDRAEARLTEIERLAHLMRDREIDARVTRLNATVRDMLRMVEKDPRDLGRARRYLGVYLTGAEEATRKYAENRARLADPALRADYLALLGDLEQSFARGRETLLADDRIDLEVEIEVLRDRLGQET